jgi:predicted RNA methylase
MRPVRTLNTPSDLARPFVLYATKGLVDVAEAELREIVPDVRLRQRTERFLVAELTPAEVERAGARARIVDDIRLLVAGPSTVRDADELDALCTAAARETRAAVPGADDAAPWSVTLSTRNPPWRRKPRWDPKPILARALHDADPDSTQRQPVDVRIQLDGEDAHAAVNIWDRPLGKQDRDITESWPGALRPTVAAALVRLAVELGGPHALYDPFCGSGTIVGEAALRGLPVYASDRSPDAVRLTRERLTRAGIEVEHRVFVRDAQSGPDQRLDARLLVTNPPWGKQVSVRDRGALFDALAQLVAHTLRAGGAAVVLTTHEEQLIARLRRHGLTAAARPIGLLGQTPAIVTSFVRF